MFPISLSKNHQPRVRSFWDDQDQNQSYMTTWIIVYQRNQRIIAQRCAPTMLTSNVTSPNGAIRYWMNDCTAITN